MYLLDSDAARCLCQYLLLEQLAAGLGCELADFAILPQLRYQLKLNKPDIAEKKLGSVEAVVLATRLVEVAAEVEISLTSANVLLFADRPDIDSGEMTLFAALCDRHNDILITGDKRALAALSHIDGADVIGELWIRLICLEEAIALILAHVGLEAISFKIRARPDVNTALTIIFGKAVASPLPSVMEGLSSYVRNVISITQNKYQLKAFDEHGFCLRLDETACS